MMISTMILKVMQIGAQVQRKRRQRRKLDHPATVEMARTRTSTCENSKLWFVTGSKNATELASLDNILSNNVIPQRSPQLGQALLPSFFPN